MAYSNRRRQNRLLGAGVVLIVLAQLAWWAFVIFVIVKVLQHFGVL